MINFAVSLTLLSTARALFNTYPGADCGWVYDVDEDRSFPTDVCTSSRSNGNAVSAMYSCTGYMTLEDGNTTRTIERFSYAGDSCEGDVTASSGVLAEEGHFQCPNGTASNDTCYLEYKEYDTSCEGGSNVSEAALSEADYTSKYIIMGKCGGVNNINRYSRCDEYNDIYYVLFIDSQCCDLAYSSTGHNGASWTAEDIEPGCNDAGDTYIDGDSWMCMMPRELVTGDPKNEVYSDNIADECQAGAISYVFRVVMVVVSLAVVYVV